ncbi:MAG: 30S ribosomal protein S20 [Coriobacteriales bacterium]|nr:30S ribosomal protein S20 [Coriobacteriales bacterium]
MANIKSQKKRILTNEKARKRNHSYKAMLKTLVKNVHAAVEEGDQELALKEAQKACKMLDKAVSKGIIHKNQAANRKSGVMALVNGMGKQDTDAESKAEEQE